MSQGVVKTDIIFDEIIKAVRAFSDPEKIILFGSRASETGTERSDIDIAVMDPEVTDRQMRRIRAAADDIRTLHRIDVVWLNNVSEEFRREILSTGKIIYEGEEKAAICD